ncbi:hypothetical protein VTI28DRAFT_2117 [Corynascus sepedonium]
MCKTKKIETPFDPVKWFGNTARLLSINRVSIQLNIIKTLAAAPGPGRFVANKHTHLLTDPGADGLPSSTKASSRS